MATKVTISFIRDGKEKTAVATLDTRQVEGEKPEPTTEEAEAKETIGVTISNITSENRRGYQLDKSATKGVVITHVKPVTAAAEANLAEGDVLLEVNGTEIGSVAEYQAEMKKAGKAKYVRFYVLRSVPRPTTFIAAVKIGE